MIVALRMPVPQTLRVRLLIGILVLVTLGLLGTNLSIYYTVSSTVTLRVDRSLANTADAIAHPESPPESLLRRIDTVVKRSQISVLMLGRNGQIVAALPEVPTPQQPYPLQPLDSPTLTDLRGSSGSPQAIEADGQPYRIIYRPMTDGMSVDDRGGSRQAVAAIIVASNFSSEKEALSRLAAVELAVSSAVLAVLTLLAFGVLRVGLRPLAGMAAAATTIANGESDRRLPVDRPHDEVGQLAAALNRAFDERHRAEEQLRRFIADASHELRTPLASIRGWADLYFQDALADKDGVDTAMTRITTDADRLIRLVEELLLLARLDEYRGLNADQVDLGNLVNDVVDDARIADPTRQIAVSIADTATVTGDRDKLLQVIRNLVGNALQHTPPGIGVHIALEHCLTEPATTCLTVADNGAGILAPDLTKIFDRFYRAPSARNTGGTGLGLAITRAIISAHHGTITVESEPGVGTRFSIVLPTRPSLPAG